MLNHLSAHTESTTRERIYQDAQNERVRARAAEARREMRRHLRALTDPTRRNRPPEPIPKLSHPTPEAKRPAAQTQLGL
ncbi:MAG: hypothetical protein GEU90_04250 [Gemmatimonas sp.]|nr:hypothetical protein [Gemmatimonas sp.]